MKSLRLKGLCVASLIAATLVLPVGAAEKTSGKTNPQKTSCPACAMMRSKLSAGDTKILNHIGSKVSPADRKTWKGMSLAEKTLLMRAVKAALLHGKMSSKMGKM